MKKICKKLLCLGLGAILTTTMMSGCGGSKRTEIDSNALTIWASQVLPESSLQNYTESPFHMGLAERVDRELVWEFPITGTSADQAFNLMIAGGELPDIIIHNISDAQSYIDQGLILSLNEYMEAGKMPNLKKFLEENPEVDKEIKTDQGNYYMFPWCREDDWLTVFRGPAVRQDWLEECGLEAPVTLEDYDNVVRVFNKKYGAKFAALDGWLSEGISVAFDAKRGYYLEDGQIKYSPVEEGYREYLEFMNGWYKDGLLDADIPSIDQDTMQKKVLNNEVGVAFTTGSQMVKWQEASDEVGNGAKWIGTSYPRKNKNANVKFSQMSAKVNGLGGMITSSCKDIDKALEILDYAYGEEGFLYWNFGIEGETYTMVDGEPIYTDVIKKADIGMIAAIDQHCGTQWAAPAVQAKGMYVQKVGDTVVEAVDTWIDKTDAKEHLLPRLSPTQEETDAISNMETTLGDYVGASHYGFIFGEQELNDDTWKAYLDKIEEIGLQQILDTKQRQLERYNNR